MRLVRRAKDEAGFDALRDACSLPSFFKLMSGAHGRRYYQAVRDQSPADLSFAIADTAGLMALVEVEVAGGALRRFGFPLEIRLRGDLEPLVLRRVVRDILGELKRLAKEQAATTIAIRTSRALDPDGIVAGQCLGLGGTPGLELRAEADLGIGGKALAEDMRKGHRQQVKWGEKNLAQSFVDAANPDRAAFERFQAFHAEVAGRVTRPAASWDAMFEAITAGKGDLVLGTLDGLLVAGSLVLDADDTAYYASGVYHRGHFDKPLAHGTVFTSLARAAKRRLRFFDVGELPLPGGEHNDKEVAIGFFKRGFTARTVESTVWTLTVDDASS